MSEKKNAGHPPLPRTPHFKKQQHWLSTTEVTGDDGGPPQTGHGVRNGRRLWDLYICVTGTGGRGGRGKQRYIERGGEDGSNRERSGWPFFAEHIDTPFVSLAHSNLHTQYAAAVW